MVIGTENVGTIALLGGMGFLGNVCYMLGGTEGFGLWMRRFLGVAIIAGATNIGALILGNWAWQYLLFFPLLGAGMSLGYGSKVVWIKVAKRALFALGVLTCGIVGMWMHDFSGAAWLIFGLSLATGLTSIALGVLNPLTNAPVEQFIICQLLTMYTIFWAFVG